MSGLSRCSLRAGQMPATEAVGQEATKGAGWARGWERSKYGER